MTAFTVHAPGGDAVAAARADRLIFVPETASWGAALVPWFWAPRHRLWLVFLIWLVATIAVEVVATTVDARLAGILSVALLVWFGLAGNDLRRWTLERRGHRLVGVVEGRSEDEAATRYLTRLAEAVRSRPAVAASAARVPSPAGAPAATTGDLP